MANNENVVVLPFKPGDDYYWIDTDDGGIHVEKGGIKAVVYYGDGKFKILNDDGCVDEPGGIYSCLSREEAEALRDKMFAKKDFI